MKKVSFVFLLLCACAPKPVAQVEPVASPTPKPPIPEATLPVGVAALHALPREAPGKAVATDLFVDDATRKAVGALLEELRSAIIRRDEDAIARVFSGDEALPSMLQQIVAAIGDRETKLKLVPLAPAGDGAWVRIVASTHLFATGSDQFEMYAGPTANGWRFFPTGPRNVVKSSLVRVKGRVRLDPNAHRLEGDAELTIRSGGERFVTVDLDLASADPEESTPDATGYRLDVVESGGKPARFEVIARADVLVVEVDPAKPEATLRFVWRGTPAGAINRLDPDSLLLHEAQPWFPVLPKTEAALDLVLEHPADYDLVPEGVVDSSKTKKKIHVPRADRGTTLVGAPKLVSKTVDLGHARAIVALLPKREARLDELAEATRLSLEAMKILGPLPSPELRVVESPVPPGVKALGGRSFLALGAAGLNHSTIAHELAHSWFGGAVTTTYRGEWGGEWPETLAEYVVLWTMDDTRARRERRGWSECYGPVRDDDEGAVRIARKSNAQSITLLYCKGPMIMAGLEQRAGREKVRAALARFVHESNRAPASWQHVVDAVRAECGGVHADWLADRLSRGRGPSLSIEDLKRDGKKVAGTIVQRFGSHQPDRLDEIVTLRFQDAEGTKLADLVLELTDRRTTFALETEARSILIDPDYQLAWKYQERATAIPK